MKNFTYKFISAVVIILMLGAFPALSGAAHDPGGPSVLEGKMPLPAMSGPENTRQIASGAGTARIEEDLCPQQEASSQTGLRPVDFRLPEENAVGSSFHQPIYLAALDTQEGPPPCGRDNICNLAACTNDPDCPSDLPQETHNEPAGSQHNEGGIGHSVWLSTGEPGFEGGHFCPPGGNTCDIMIHWSVQPDKYDRWKICWKEHGTLFTNACEENQKVRSFENNFYLLPNLRKDREYRLRLEGRKDKNDKWKCLVKATLRSISLNGTSIASAVPCIVP